MLLVMYESTEQHNALGIGRRTRTKDHSHTHSGVPSMIRLCLNGLIIWSATASALTAEPVDGWTPEGGCKDICLGGPKMTCLDESKCGNKTASPGDYDFLTLDQIWVPQFCRDLANGHDITVTHPSNSKCVPGQVKNILSIHGLWPNYYGGYPACCSSDAISNFPMVPIDGELGAPLLERLQSMWHDPTNVASRGRESCYMWNHEWQKHGVCGAWVSPTQYLTHTMDIVDSAEMTIATDTLNAWAAEERPVQLADVHALYTHRVSVTCSSLDPTHVSSIRACFGKSSNEIIPIDCPAGGDDCEADVPLVFYLWAPPSQVELGRSFLLGIVGSTILLIVAVAVGYVVVHRRRIKSSRPTPLMYSGPSRPTQAVKPGPYERLE